VGLKDIAQKVTSYQPVPDYDSPDNPTWQVMCAILKEWIDNHPKPILLMPIPLYQHVEETSDPSQYQARFSEIAEITNCIIHDPCPELLKYPQEVRRRFRFKKDIHPTTEGHAALATSLAPIVEQLLDDPK
jgi:carbamoyltransferase